MTLSWCSAVSSKWSDRLVVVPGIVLAVAGLMACVYGVRVAGSQYDYFRLKYGRLADAAPEVKAVLAERAHARYPLNYYLCQLVTDDFQTHSGEGGWVQRQARRTAAADWCERGRRLNPYGRELAWLAAGIARLKSPEAALAIWEPYVERVFWDPWNLAVLIRLRVDAGRLDAARKLLPLLYGHPEYAAAASAIGN